MESKSFGSFKLKITTTTIAVLCSICGGNNVRAQVVSDRTTNTQVQVNNDISQITGGIQAGNNLFHSFQEFSLETNAVANFEHGLDISNIFSRVTGGNISQINGSIQTQGNANLFLLNPAGIIFGANAQLNVGGSFIASTADRVIFADGIEFSAVTPEAQPILTIATPIGLQYGTGTSGEIAVLPNANREANDPSVGLSIRSGNTLALLGGDVSLARNSLNGIGSNIEIGSIKAGRVNLQPVDRGWQFDYAPTQELGQIELSNRALINSSGEVNLRGKTINFSTSSGIRNFTDFNGTGGAIGLEARESINLDSSFLFTQVGQIRSNLEQAIAGMGGDILIKAPQISFTNGTVISAGTLSTGAGGNITLEALETIELSSALGSNPSIISTSTQGSGDGGKIEVNTGRLFIYDGSQIQAIAGEGAGGEIIVNASESIAISGTGILRSQDSPGSFTETVLASGFVASSGIAGLPLAERPQGESGSLVINTPELIIEDSATVSVSNYGLANAGNIEINALNLNLNTRGEITANTASGKGGSITITAEDSIILNNARAISTTAEQSGDGGNIFVEADNLVLLESDSISANAQQGSGGNININTQGLFTDPDSSITASSEIETKAGTIKIDTLDINSRLQMDYKEYSPLVAEDYIYTGCGAGEDYAKNSFRNIGRGGIPSNPIEDTISLNTVGDLGKAGSKSKSVKSSNNISQHSGASYQSISEANAWKINDRGNVELIAQKPTALVKLSACQL